MDQAELPKYQSHKKVWAVKIAAIEFGEYGIAKISPKDEGYAPFETKVAYKLKFQGDEDDLGYYVLYKDGYESWSPSDPFERGYTRIE